MLCWWPGLSAEMPFNPLWESPRGTLLLDEWSIVSGRPRAQFSHARSNGLTSGLFAIFHCVWKHFETLHFHSDAG